MCLKEAGLRSCSGPFDWMGFRQPLSRYVDILVSDFSFYMLKENLHFVKEDPVEGVARYEDCITGLSSVHDFKLGVPFDDMYVQFRQVLDRRIARLLSVLRLKTRILFVHYRGEGHYESSELMDEMEKLRRKFPRSTIDLLVLETAKGVSSPTVDAIGPGVVRIVGDFYDQQRFDVVVGNERLVLEALRCVRMRGRWRNLLWQKVQSVKRRLLRHVRLRGGRGFAT